MNEIIDIINFRYNISYWNSCISLKGKNNGFTCVKKIFRIIVRGNSENS